MEKKSKLPRHKILELKEGDKICIEDVHPDYEFYGKTYEGSKRSHTVTVVEVYKSKKFDRVKYKSDKSEFDDKERIGNLTVGKNISEDGTFNCSISSSGSTSRYTRSVYLVTEDGEEIK